MVNRSEAHTRLIDDAIIALAKNGYCAWKSNAGAIKNENGVFIRYGKVGCGDITGILPPHGKHFEAEGKTGNAVQRKSQKIHEEFVVKKNGGIYIIFRSVDELLTLLHFYNRN